MLFSTSALADLSSHTCKRESLNTSGFTTTAAAESWYPAHVKFEIDPDRNYSKFGRYRGTSELRYDNKRVTINLKRGNQSGAYSYRIIMLANGEVHADLRTPGGFRSAGGAVYSCTDWDGDYTNTLKLPTGNTPAPTPQKKKYTVSDFKVRYNSLKECLLDNSATFQSICILAH